MKPETRTVNALFERDVRYAVPLYQRPYVWDEEHQWEPLWGDISVLLDHQLDGHKLGPALWSHFLGAIVLEQKTLPPGSIPEYTVIDGQQRLSTLQILVAAASRALADRGAERDSQLLAELTTNNPLKASGTDLFKVWPTNANREAFRAVMQAGGPPEDRHDDPNNRIDEAYDYFVKQVASWLDDEEPTPELFATRAETLRVTLCDLLKLVSITLEPDDNAQVIFETLNARGTPLLALDLVKNAVFHEASRQALDVDTLYTERWKPQLDDPYWRVERRQGRLRRAHGELFLMHWLGMKVRRVIPATELFPTFRGEILNSQPAPEMAKLVPEICRDAEILRGFDDQPAGSPEHVFFQRLEALDTTTVMPLVLLLFREGEITQERRRRALHMLESWLVRRALLRLTSKNYNKEIPLLLEKIAADPAGADEAILEHLRTGTGEISRWPDDHEVTSHLEERPVYNVVSRARLQMVLAAVERHLRSHNKVENVSLPTDLSLEHVMPQTWEKGWPVGNGLGAEAEARQTAERNARIHKLGNLTLTTGALNSSLSNAPWSKKREALADNSVLLLNSELISTYPDSFDDQGIDQRTRLFSERICAIWPSADSAVWVTPNS